MLVALEASTPPVERARAAVSRSAILEAMVPTIEICDCTPAWSFWSWVSGNDLVCTSLSMSVLVSSPDASPPA